MEKAMVRYGVLNNDRKDTLYTFRAGDQIFFGIARCNLKAGDKFDRDLGVKIATARAFKAKALVDSGEASPTESGKLDEVTWNVSYGCVPVGDVKSLLNYFHTLRTTVRL